MRILMLVLSLLVSCGCVIVTKDLYTEDEVCNLCCKLCGARWRCGEFLQVDETNAEWLVGRMFRDHEFFTPEVLVSYDSQAMKKKLACGEARGYCAESDEKEIYLYVDLNERILEDPEEGDYHYYSYDYIIYNKKSNCIDRVGCSSVDWLDLDLERNSH